jgi:hypothetical protein
MTTPNTIFLKEAAPVPQTQHVVRVSHPIRQDTTADMQYNRLLNYCHKIADLASQVNRTKQSPEMLSAANKVLHALMLSLGNASGSRDPKLGQEELPVEQNLNSQPDILEQLIMSFMKCNIAPNQPKPASFFGDSFLSSIDPSPPKKRKISDENPPLLTPPAVMPFSYSFAPTTTSAFSAVEPQERRSVTVADHRPRKSSGSAPLDMLLN